MIEVDKNTRDEKGSCNSLLSDSPIWAAVTMQD